MNAIPKVSIILPVYNASEYLSDCIASVCRQDISELELICVDDGSTDNSIDILKEWARKDQRVKIISQFNATASVARNKALDAAKGEFVAFLDADDMYHGTDALSTLYKLAKENNCPVAGGAVLSFTKTPGDLWKEPRQPDGLQEGIHDYAASPFDYNYQMFIFDREMLIRSKVRFPLRTRYQDPPFMARAMKATGKYVTCRHLVYLYRWGHQVFDWKKTNFQKLRDVLSGMADVVSFAQAEGLPKLVTLTRDRFLSAYAKAFFDQDIPIDDIPEYRLFLSSLPDADVEKIRKAQREIQTGIAISSLSSAAVTAKQSAVKVSVIIPSLNTGRYVRQCLESVANQTLKDIEIICVDAGSTDGTLEIIRSFESSDKRFKVFVSDRKSYGRQMNIGIANAVGEYIGIVEPDDYIDLRMYERLYEEASRHSPDFIKSDLVRFKTIDGKEKETYSPLTPDKSWYGRIIDTQETPEALRLTLNNPTGIFRRAFIVKNDIKFNETPGASYQDVGFWIQTFLLGRRALFLNEGFYHYRNDNEASSVNSATRLYCINKEYHFVMEWLDRHVELRKKFLPWVTWAKFGNYNFTLTLARDEHAVEYAMRMYGVFAEDESSGALNRSLMNPYQRGRLDALLADPIKFAVSHLSEKGVAELISKIEQAAPSSRNVAKTAPAAPVSAALPPSAGVFSRAMQCYRDNGLIYTLKRIVFGKKR